MRSYRKSFYLDMVTGRIDQATAFGRPHQQPERYYLIGHYFSLNAKAEFINRNMQLHITGRGIDMKIDIPKAARKQRRFNAKKQAEVNNPERILAEAKKAVFIVAENPYPDPKRYYVNAYQGCGVYRLAIRDGKIAAVLYGGYHGSCPYGIAMNQWLPVIREQMEQHGQVVKADGSGTMFFLREKPQQDLIPVKIYDVPAPHGNGSHGFVHENVQVN